MLVCVSLDQFCGECFQCQFKVENIIFLSDFIILVLSFKDVVYGWEEGCFELFDEELVGGQFGKVCYFVLQESEDVLGDVKEWNDLVYGDVGEEEYEWDLIEDGVDDVYCLELDQFVVLEVEVFFQVGDVGVVCVVLVGVSIIWV